MEFDPRFSVRRRQEAEDESYGAASTSLGVDPVTGEVQ